MLNVSIYYNDFNKIFFKNKGLLDKNKNTNLRSDFFKYTSYIFFKKILYYI